MTIDDEWAWEASIDAALRLRPTPARRVAPRAWRVSVGDGEGARIVAEEPWLIIDARMPGNGGGAASACRVLERNATLPGPVKLALAPGGELHLRTELPLDAPGGLGAHLDRALALFEQLVREDGRSTRVSAERQPPVGAAAWPVTEYCSLAGWQCAERPDGSVAVDLDVPDDYRQAIVRPLATPAARAAVLLVPGGAAASAAVCREATALLVLRASGLVRLVRGALGIDGEAEGPCFEVVLFGEPGVAVLAHALAALSIGCRLCGREAETLWRDEAVARAYLGQQTWPRATAQP